MVHAVHNLLQNLFESPRIEARTGREWISVVWRACPGKCSRLLGPCESEVSLYSGRRKFRGHFADASKIVWLIRLWNPTWCSWSNQIQTAIFLTPSFSSIEYLLAFCVGFRRPPHRLVRAPYYYGVRGR